MNKQALISMLAASAIIVAGGAFYGGIVFAKSQTPRSFAGANLQNFKNRQGGGGNGINMTSGSIISKDDKSITLQLPNNGGSKIIFYSQSTQIGKFTSGTSDDLTSGINVSIVGTANSDGSVTAQNIQIRPAGQNGPTGSK